MVCGACASVGTLGADPGPCGGVGLGRLFIGSREIQEKSLKT